MHIAVLHSFYRSTQPSGENSVVVDQVRALREAGHQVTEVFRYTEEIRQQKGYRLRSGERTWLGYGANPLAPLEGTDLDVVHVHNLFPNFGDRWVSESPWPVVATVHNFRPLCAAGTLFRAGDTCTLCPDEDWTNAVRYGCYQGSRVATLPLALRNRRGIAGNRLLSAASRLVFLSERARRTYLYYGLPRQKTVLLPNFGTKRGVALPEAARSGKWLYAGRLSPEKGISRLLRAWPPETPLEVLGSGDEEAKLRADYPHVDFGGQVSPEQVLEPLSVAKGLVLPSLCAEGMPQIYVDAMSRGTPVLTVAGCSAADHAIENETGIVLDRTYGRTDVQAGIAAVSQHWLELSAASQAVFARDFDELAWVRRMTALYESVLDVGLANRGPAAGANNPCRDHRDR